MEITMSPANSSAIEAIGYHPESRTLRVRMKGGRTYDYAGVPQERHTEFLAAESQGKFFAAHIKGKHEATKVEAEEGSQAQ